MNAARYKTLSVKDVKQTNSLLLLSIATFFVISFAKYLLHLSEASTKSVLELSGMALALGYVIVSANFEYTLVRMNAGVRGGDADHFTALFKFCIGTLVFSALFIWATWVGYLVDSVDFTGRYSSALFVFAGPIAIATLFWRMAAAWRLLIRAYNKL